MLVLFLCSAACTVGMLYYGTALKKPGMFPPKMVMKKRAETLGFGGLLFFLLGLFAWMAGGK